MNSEGRWGKDQNTHCREGEAGHQDLSRGNTVGSQKPNLVLTKLQQIAKKARECPELVFNNVAHLIDIDMLLTSFKQLRKKSASGYDGVTYDDYKANLFDNLKDLYDRLKSGRYKAPPVKRVWIDKDDGKKRPLGIPAIEDKIVQKAASEILGAIYEQDFCDFSYGFRKGHSQHQALGAFRDLCNKAGVKWIVDMDIKAYFDTINHKQLMEFLRLRIADKNFLRLIGKWLKAGVLEDEILSYPKDGSPQGGIVSPILSNVYLHYTLDIWFRDQITKVLKGRAAIVRYADDAVMCFSDESDARRFMKVLPKRFEKFGLTVHPEKTKLVPFHRPNSYANKISESGTFDFLGFTHFWGITRNKSYVIKRKISSKKLRSKMKILWRWCRFHRHDKESDQYESLYRKLTGHYQYYGVRCNMRSMEKYYYFLERAWHYWLSRRHRSGKIKWDDFRKKLEKYFPLPKPRITHAI